jgi:hypothetical protein
LINITQNNIILYLFFVNCSDFSDAVMIFCWLKTSLGVFPSSLMKKKIVRCCWYHYTRFYGRVFFCLLITLGFMEEFFFFLLITLGFMEEFFFCLLITLGFMEEFFFFLLITLGFMKEFFFCCAGQLTIIFFVNRSDLSDVD